MKEIKNNQKKFIYIWLLIGVIFLILGIISYIDFDINSPDGFMILISIFMLILSIIMSAIFHKRSKILQKSIDKNSFIAKLKYKSNDWNKFLKQELKFRLNENSGIFKFLSIITSIIFITFILFIDEAQFEMFLVMLALIILYAFMGFIMPRIKYLISSGDALILIFDEGILFNNTFHIWDFFGSKLEKINIKKTPFKHLEIIYSFVDRLGRRSYTINIPMIGQDEEQFRKICDKLERIRNGKTL